PERRSRGGVDRLKAARRATDDAPSGDNRKGAGQGRLAALLLPQQRAEHPALRRRILEQRACPAQFLRGSAGRGASQARRSGAEHRPGTAAALIRALLAGFAQRLLQLGQTDLALAEAEAVGRLVAEAFPGAFGVRLVAGAVKGESGAEQLDAVELVDADAL